MGQKSFLCFSDEKYNEQISQPEENAFFFVEHLFYLLYLSHVIENITAKSQICNWMASLFKI